MSVRPGKANSTDKAKTWTVGRTAFPKIDWVGGVILLLYIGFSVFRGQIFTPLINASQLAGFLPAVSAVSAGTMLGRLVGTSRGVRRVLRAWGLERGDAGTPPGS